ncbi:MAG TPA: hypothetical protein VFF13_07000 [archaeon]|nr:hypothetical protein [archaeon]
MVTKRFSSATQKLREKQKKTAKAVRQQATRESDAKKREYTSRMQPEKKLDPAQEERCKGIVTRVLKKLGHKQSDFSAADIGELVGIARAQHLDVIRGSRRTSHDYGKFHALLFLNRPTSIKLNTDVLVHITWNVQLEAQKTFWKKK